MYGFFVKVRRGLEFGTAIISPVVGNMVNRKGDEGESRKQTKSMPRIGLVSGEQKLVQQPLRGVHPLVICTVVVGREVQHWYVKL